MINDCVSANNLISKEFEWIIVHVFPILVFYYLLFSQYITSSTLFLQIV